ncbi:MAG: DUF2231 domain-containing protein [Kiritimatiellia bacterium]
MKTLSIATVISLIPLASFAGAGETLQRVGQMVGPFHILLLHLPIGMLLAVLLLDILSLLPSRRDALSQASLTLQWIGAPLALIAAVSGFLLSKSGDFTASAALERHMWLGIGVALAWFAMVAVRQAANSNPTVTRYLAYTLLLLGNSAMTVLAGHDGGTLVHGEGFLTKNLPAGVKSALRLDGAPSAAAGGGCGRAARTVDRLPGARLPHPGGELRRVPRCKEEERQSAPRYPGIHPGRRRTRGRLRGRRSREEQNSFVRGAAQGPR